MDRQMHSILDFVYKLEVIEVQKYFMNGLTGQYLILSRSFEYLTIEHNANCINNDFKRFKTASGYLLKVLKYLNKEFINGQMTLICSTTTSPHTS